MSAPAGTAAGIWVCQTAGQDDRGFLLAAQHRLDELGLGRVARWTRENIPPVNPDFAGCPRSFDPALTGTPALHLRFDADIAAILAPDHDTLALRQKLDDALGSHPDTLARETMAALLLSPFPLVFPSLDEWEGTIRIRTHIAHAATRTALAFDTTAIERPTDCWQYQKGHGFILLPGVSLIEALRKATQPAVSGQLFSFSCYRATEYVILLGICEELERTNPALLTMLEQHWQKDAIMSGAFHDTFVREYGTIASPLPAKYYVPGDRVWFRNPDERSADIVGYEGSWTIYKGNGLFANFWQRNRPFSLPRKCVEVYHWRDAVSSNTAGEAVIDEDEVEHRVAASLADAAATQAIVERMSRIRDPKGIYQDGGCIDATREGPRWICPGTTDMLLPAA